MIVGIPASRSFLFFGVIVARTFWPWEPPNADSGHPDWLRSGNTKPGKFRGSAVAALHKRAFRNFILFEQFQIELPLNENAIILARKADISPVGVRPGAKNGLPP
ncbi:MAG: hypothetical protein WBF73_32255 [Bradyrhizobium sp.]